jgi:endogenous inhibitor of DNA gyrase (YacG/DUF329 family)
MTVRVKCPTCRQEIAYDARSPFRPFCSERCRLIDLGAWSQESFRIPVIEEDDGLNVHTPLDDAPR